MLASARMHDDVVEALAEQARALKLGDTFDPETTLGPVNSARQLGSVTGFLERRPDHARVVTGGKQADSPGFFLEPTVIDGLRQDDEMVQKEIFGPVITVQRFDDEAKALEWANGTPYGLAGSVWTSDVGRALRMSQGDALRLRVDQRPPAVRVRDAARRLQAVRLRQGPLDVRARGLHGRQARHGKLELTWPLLTSRPAPYLNAVVAYGFRGSTRFHVPGHKAGNGADLGVRTAIGWQTLKLDIPQDIHGVDLGESPTPFERAEELAAEAYGAARSWFLTNGATQGNHALCLALAPLGAPVVVQRNAHASVIDGLVLSRRPADLGAAAVRARARHGARRDAGLAAAPRSRRRRARAPRSSSPPPTTAWPPTSRAARRSRTRPACRWWSTSRGARTSASTATCRRARCRVGADAMLTSVHKIAGSLTQSALLHVSDSGRIDPDAVARTLRLMRSTSPSSLLMLSLDGARRQLVLHGEALLSNTIAASRRTADAIDEIPGCRVVGDEEIGRPGVAARDPLRIVIDVRGTGATGYEMAAALRSNFDTQVELATQATIVLVLGIDEHAARARALRARPDVDRRRRWSARARSRRSRSPPARSRTRS